MTFYYNRGIALQNQRQTDAAINDFSEALKLASKFHKANVSRAIALLEKGDVDGAIAEDPLESSDQPGTGDRRVASRFSVGPSGLNILYR